MVENIVIIAIIVIVAAAVILTMWWESRSVSDNSLKGADESKQKASEKKKNV